jgi:hypothetical protein
MSALSRTRWRQCLVAAFVGMLSLGALTIPTAPAKARVFIGFGIGAPVGWGYVPRPYYGYYGYPYYRAYYGYPHFFVGGTFGPHYHHWHHSRHW